MRIGSRNLELNRYELCNQRAHLIVKQVIAITCDKRDQTNKMSRINDERNIWMENSWETSVKEIILNPHLCCNMYSLWLSSHFSPSLWLLCPGSAPLLNYSSITVSPDVGKVNLLSLDASGTLLLCIYISISLFIQQNKITNLRFEWHVLTPQINLGLGETVRVLP